jgi:hypothetical protein
MSVAAALGGSGGGSVKGVTAMRAMGSGEGEGVAAGAWDGVGEIVRVAGAAWAVGVGGRSVDAPGTSLQALSNRINNTKRRVLVRNMLNFLEGLCGNGEDETAGHTHFRYLYGTKNWLVCLLLYVRANDDIHHTAWMRMVVYTLDEI